jgi:hypothetical protein
MRYLPAVPRHNNRKDNNMTKNTRLALGIAGGLVPLALVMALISAGNTRGGDALHTRGHDH